MDCVVTPHGSNIYSVAAQQVKQTLSSSQGPQGPVGVLGRTDKQLVTWSFLGALRRAPGPRRDTIVGLEDRPESGWTLPPPLRLGGLGGGFLGAFLCHLPCDFCLTQTSDSLTPDDVEQSGVFVHIQKEQVLTETEKCR